MQLFKRLLLSLFPEEIVNQNVNPASMFVSFISTKDFFSVINRKIVENYKLNLFDIGLDSLDFKVGFGDKYTFKKSNSDLYYSYCAASNLNGYRFLNPANLSTSVALISAIYTKDIYSKYNSYYYLNFLYCVYMLSFVFLSRIKVFPYSNREENYNWFVEVFFEFYRFIFQQTSNKIDDNIFLEIKKNLIKEVEVFFMLFEFYKLLSDCFSSSSLDDNEFYSWLFYEEKNSNEYKNIISDFLSNEKYKYKTKFSLTEKKIIPIILPADIMVRYLFLDVDMFLMVEYVLLKVFDKKTLNEYLKSFRKDNSKLEEFILYITDYRLFKKNFFAGIQKYVVTIFRSDKNDLSKNIESDIDQDIDEIMSSIENDVESINNMKIPERIKKESKMMEKVLNFYVTFFGGFWISRGDNFFFRLFKKDMINALIERKNKKGMIDYSAEELTYCGNLLNCYGKNIFYYKYASDNIRSGKQKFFVPFRSKVKNIYSNLYTLNLFDENSIVVVVQDFNPKDIRIYIKNKNIISKFKHLFGNNVSECIKLPKNEIIKYIYNYVDVLCDELFDFTSILSKNIKDDELYHLKDNIYTIDFWISNMFYSILAKNPNKLKTYYSSFIILGIISNIRETFFGFLLYIRYMDKISIESKTDLFVNKIIEIYIIDVLNINKYELVFFKESIDTIYLEMSDLLDLWIGIDDNKDFFKISYDNWVIFIKDKININGINKILGEDIVWFRGFLKNITYYNRRFLIPK